MSTEYKFENHEQKETRDFQKSKVKLTDLLSKLNQEKKKERNSTIGKKHCSRVSIGNYEFLYQF